MVFNKMRAVCAAIVVAIFISMGVAVDSSVALFTAGASAPGDAAILTDTPSSSSSSTVATRQQHERKLFMQDFMASIWNSILSLLNFFDFFNMIPDPQTPDPGTTSPPAGAPTPAPNDGIDSLLTYAFRPDQDEPLFLALNMQIFDLSADDVDVQFLPKSDTRYYKSDSVIETAQKFAADVSIEGSYGAFSGKAKASTENLSSRKVKKVRIDALTTTEKYVTTLLPLYPHEKLTPAAKEFLLSETPENIVTGMGSFFATQLTTGAVVQVSVVTESRSQEESSRIQAEFQASYGQGLSLIKGSASLEKEEETVSSCTSMSYEYRAQGGDPTIWLRPDDVTKLQADWADSVNDSNLHPTAYRLRPIWELLDHEDMDVSKSAELREYMESQWNEDTKGAEEYDISDYVPTKKVVADSITIYQPAEELGSYDARSISKSACEFVNEEQDNHETQGCWSLDDLICSDNKQ